MDTTSNKERESTELRWQDAIDEQVGQESFTPQRPVNGRFMPASRSGPFPTAESGDDCTNDKNPNG